MASTNINIYIKSEDDDGTITAPKSPGSSPDNNNPTKQKEKKGQSSSMATAAIALHLGKQAINMAKLRVGQYTRNSALQDTINSTLKIAGYAYAIYANPVLGSIALGVDITSSLLDYGYNRKLEQNRLGILQERAGSNINRSR